VTTTYTVTFPADELATPVPQVNFEVLVIDDEKNEALEQFFVITLEVINATNPSLIDLSVRQVSACIVVDNDRESSLITIINIRTVDIGV